jgi:GTP-binding protein LepA
VDQTRVRNFCIIAHIDHGKSTLADRLLEKTGTLSSREMQDQVLDSMDLERERGITIKSHAIRMNYTARDGQEYILNLIDTPGHVDFTYEVSRALQACEGAILVVDAAQGIEAQTISNLYLALSADLEILPVLNKVDLPSARPEVVAQSVLELIGGGEGDVLGVSAKTGLGVDEVLEAVVARVPPPSGDPEAPLKALIFDSVFDQYRGAIAYVRVFEGVLRKGDPILFMGTGKKYYAEEIGVLKLGMQPVQELRAGEVGYIVGSVKDVRDTRVGDTVTRADKPAATPVPGFQEAKPMVFSGVYPTETEDFEDLRASLDKLKLNDAALSYEPETSVALGFGFRVGFLGMLHMEIVQERLEREFGMGIITTMPNVRYEVTLTDGSTVIVENPSEMPPPGRIQEIREPYIRAQIITPTDYIGTLMTLCQERRGIYVNTQYLSTDRVDLQYELPLAEAVFDFYDHRQPYLPPGEAGRAAQRRPGRRPFDDRPPRQGVRGRAQADAEAARAHPEADVRGRHPGGHWHEGHRARDRQGNAQGRDGQVLRRRHLAQAQAPREAEGGQEAHEAGRPRGGAAGGLPGGALDGQRLNRARP